MKSVKVAYVSFAVPIGSVFEQERGFSPAGNLAQNGFVEALAISQLGIDKVWSFQPVAIWPRGSPLFSYGRSVELIPGICAHLLPLANLPVVREAVRLAVLSWKLLTWSIVNIGHPRVVVVYNIFFPQAFFMRILTWLLHVRFVAIIYELGTIGGYRVNLWHRIFNMGIMQRLGFWCIPRLDGRILISDAIARDFAPQKHYIRIDGGITRAVVRRLFPLKVSDHPNELRLMFAGGINPWNHIDALLSFMSANRDPRLRLWVAGAGRQVCDVQKAAESDDRIVYLGMLNHDGLFRRYEQADILLNLRDMTDPALAYHFPSKLLEMLVLGKPVITSNTNHAGAAYGAICKVIDSINDLGESVDEFLRMSPVERLEYGRRARAWMLAQKTWEAQGDAIGEYIATQTLAQK